HQHFSGSTLFPRYLLPDVGKAGVAKSGRGKSPHHVQAGNRSHLRSERPHNQSQRRSASGGSPRRSRSLTGPRIGEERRNRVPKEIIGSPILLAFFARAPALSEAEGVGILTSWKSGLLLHPIPPY